MQKVCIIGAVCAFFKAVVTRIICIIATGYVKCGRSVRGGVNYWRGHVFGGGAVGKKGGGAVYAEQVSAVQGGFVAKSVALYRLAVGLPGNAEQGGGVGVGGVVLTHQVNQADHGAMPPVKARRRVVVSPAWGRFDKPTCLRQRVVDGADKVESVSFMPL